MAIDECKAGKRQVSMLLRLTLQGRLALSANQQYCSASYDESALPLKGAHHVTVCKKRNHLGSERARNDLGQESVTNTTSRACSKLVIPESWRDAIGSKVHFSDVDKRGHGIKQEQQSRCPLRTPDYHWQALSERRRYAILP